MRENKKNRQKRIQKLKDKYRLIIYNDDSFEEVVSYRLNKLNVFYLIAIASTVLVTSVYFLIAYTPLKEYVIPDYPKLEERQKIMDNVMRVDSIENVLRLYEQKMEILSILFNGGEPPQYVGDAPDSLNNIGPISFEKSIFDSLMRAEIQESEALSVNNQAESYISNKFTNIYFIPPVRGIISSKFNAIEKHYGTDIVSKKNSIIQSVLPGTVIFDGWSVETGFVIMIQHEYNFVSVYKHNSKLLKVNGDKVQAGEGIAIIGNTGEMSTGPHLHFELWHEGQPINSEEFIVY